MINLFSKTDQSVKKTRESWFKKVADLFNSTKIDENVWGELEELLISADVGIATTDKSPHILPLQELKAILSEGIRLGRKLTVSLPGGLK